MPEASDTWRRLDELEQRVRVLERRLAMRGLVERSASEETALPESVGSTSQGPPPSEPELQFPPPEPVLPEIVPAVAHAEIPAMVEPATAREAVATPIIEAGPSPAVPPPPPYIPLKLPAKRPPATSFDLERLIGGRWFAAIGAVAVVIGVGLFVKLAYEQGWLNRIPPAGKCISGGLFGLALLGVGEFIRRRLGAVASAGISAAGIGALFASAYASHGQYHLTSAPVAFALLGAVAALGFTVAARGNLVSIAVLSLLAGYLNPLVIGEPVAGPLVMPAYLFALLCTALALSAWRAYPFRVLRGLAWWGTLAYGTWWCMGVGLSYPVSALSLMAGVWLAVHGELALSARSPRIAAPATPLTGELIWTRARFMATSFSTTAWSAMLAVYTIRHGTALDDWWPPALLALAASALAIRLAGNLRILRDIPRTDGERLGAALAMQAGALIMTTVALALTGWMEVAGWLSLGAAAIGAGRWVRSRGLEVYGLIALSIATGRLLIHDAPWFSIQPWEQHWAGLVLTRWTILMAVAAGAWALASGLARPDAVPLPPPRHGVEPFRWEHVRTAALILAFLHLNIGLTHPSADAGSVCVAWLALGLAGMLLSRLMRLGPLTAYGIFGLTAATLRFGISAPMLGPSSPILAQPGGIVLTRWTALMAIGAAAWILASRLIPRQSPTGQPHVLSGRTPRIAALIIGLSFLNLSLLHPDSDAGAVCVLWLLLGIAGIILGRTMNAWALAVYGLLVLAGASIRFLAGAPITGGASPALIEAAGLIITRWTVFMLVGALAWFIGAAILRDPPPRHGVANRTTVRPKAALVGVGLSMVFVSILHPQAFASSIALAWLALAVIATLAHSLFKRLVLDIYGLVGLAASAIAWGVAYPRGWMASTSPLTLHPGLWSSALIAAGATGLWWWLRSASNPSRPTEPNLLKFLIPGAAALLFISTSYEIARVGGDLSSDPTARRAAVSIWWGLVGVGLIAAGFWRRLPAARHAGLALLGIATAKAIAFDLAFVPQIWRVASFIGLGLLMLGVAVGYARVSARLARAEEAPRV